MLNSKAIFYFSTFSPIFYFFWFRASLIYLNFLQKFTKTSIFRSITIEYRISSNNPTPLNNRTPSINRTPKMEVEIIIGHLRIIGHVRLLENSTAIGFAALCWLIATETAVFDSKLTVLYRKWGRK